MTSKILTQIHLLNLYQSNKEERKKGKENDLSFFPPCQQGKVNQKNKGKKMVHSSTNSTLPSSTTYRPSSKSLHIELPSFNISCITQQNKEPIIRHEPSTDLITEKKKTEKKQRTKEKKIEEKKTDF